MTIWDIPRWLTASFRKPAASRRIRLADALCLRYVGALDIYVLAYGEWERVLSWERQGHTVILDTFTALVVRNLESLVLVAPPKSQQNAPGRAGAWF